MQYPITTVFADISDHDVAVALNLAFETGSTSWVASPNGRRGDAPDSSWANPDLRVVVTTRNDGDADRPITQATIQLGLQQLADDYPSFFGDLAGDEDLDDDGADTLLQLIVFGEVRY